MFRVLFCSPELWRMQDSYHTIPDTQLSLDNECASLEAIFDLPPHLVHEMRCDGMGG